MSKATTLASIVEEPSDLNPDEFDPIPPHNDITTQAKERRQKKEDEIKLKECYE
jgi:hypothetical protein